MSSCLFPAAGEGSTACAVQEALDDAKTVDPDEPAPRAGVWQPGPEPGAMTRRRLLVAFLLFMINAGALVFTLGWKVTEEGSMAEAIMLAVGGGVFLLFTGIFHALIKPMYIPPRYQVIVGALLAGLPARRQDRDCCNGTLSMVIGITPCCC